MRKYFVFLGSYLIITSLMVDFALGQTRTYQTGILKRIKDGVQALDFHPDGTKILIGGGDHSLKLWNLSTDKIDFEIPLTREVYSVLWLPNGKYFLANAGMVIQAYSDQGIYHNQLMGHNTAIWSMDTDPTGEYLVSGSFSKSYMIWNISEMVPIKTVSDHKKSVLAVCFSPDGSQIASGSLDQTIRIREFPSGKFLASAVAHTENIYDIEYHPSGKLIATASRDHTIKIWDIDSARVVRKLEGHGGPVFSINFSPNGFFLLSASADQTIKLWETSSGKLIYTFIGHQAAVNEVLFSPGGKTFASGAMDGTVRIWELHPEIIVNFCCEEDFNKTLEGHELFLPQGDTESNSEYKKRMEEQQKLRLELAQEYYSRYIKRLELDGQYK